MDKHLKNPLESIASLIVSDSRDWSMNWRDARLYGIVIGWSQHDDPDAPEEDAMSEVAAKFGWTDDYVAQLQALHAAYQQLAYSFSNTLPMNENKMIYTIDRVHFSDKWIEFWFQETHLFPNETSFHLCSKQSSFWDAVEAAGLYDEVLSKGLNGRQLEWKQVSVNQEIVGFVMPAAHPLPSEEEVAALFGGKDSPGYKERVEQFLNDLRRDVTGQQ